MVHKLDSLIGSPDVRACVEVPGDGRYWVRAVPLPFYGGLFDRLNDAWAVIKGNAYAVRWPEPGEFEQACRPNEVAPWNRKHEAPTS